MRERLKEKKDIIILLIVVVVFYGIFSVYQFIKMPYTGSWTFKYDEDENLICKEFSYFTAWKPAQRISYEYDEEGNRILIDDDDILYGEGDEYIEFGYEEGKFAFRIVGGQKYNYSYENSKSIFVKSENADYGSCYRYDLNDEGKVTSITQGVWKDNHFNIENVWCECSYNQKGQIKSLSYSGLMETDTFSYEYNSMGRYSRIKVESDCINGTSLTAVFRYKLLSKDYTAYVYNDVGEMIEKYVYKHNLKGDLKKVHIYKPYAYDYSWNNVGRGGIEGYPGSEVPDNFLERP